MRRLKTSDRALFPVSPDPLVTDGATSTEHRRRYYRRGVTHNEVPHPLYPIPGPNHPDP